MIDLSVTFGVCLILEYLQWQLQEFFLSLSMLVVRRIVFDTLFFLLILSDLFPFVCHQNLVALNLWGNRLQDTEKVMQEIRKCPKLKALWLNDNPVLGKGSELNLSFPSVACLSNSFVHTFIAIQGSNRIQIEENC